MSANKETKSDNMTPLQKAVRDLRRNKDTPSNNETIKCNFLKELGYMEDSEEITTISIVEFDAFIIRVIRDYFGSSLNADILLMASGLLDGFSYHLYPKITGRRNKFLENSPYLENYPISEKAKAKAKAKEDQEYTDQEDADQEDADQEDASAYLNDITDFSDLDTDGKRSYYANIKGIENNLFDDLSEFLLKKDIKEYIKEENPYLRRDEKTEKILGVVLPLPSYHAPNYERLIWLELKKANKRWWSSGSMKNLAIRCKEAVIENRNKLVVSGIILLLATLTPLAVSLVQPYTNTKQSSIDNPFAHGEHILDPIYVRQRDDDEQQINNLSQEATDKDNVHSAQTAKNSF